MSTVQLRRKAKALIDDLSASQLHVVSEFLAFIKTRDSDAATLELLAIPGFEASYSHGINDIKAGRTTSWRKGRTDVKGGAVARGAAILQSI